jgi:hypothetical protein
MADDKQYVVTGKYVTAKTMTSQGPRVLGLHEGAPVPPDVPQEWVTHHLNMDLIKELPAPDPEPAPKADAPAKPDAPAKADAPKAATARTTRDG